MRPTLVLAILALVPACASSGRTTGTTHDAHVVTPDGGTHPDATVDSGRASDTGATTDTGNETLDTGPAPHDSGPIVVRDAYAPDTGTDTGCASAADCNDHIGCNGIERCESGLCVAGTAVTCDDGLSCTTDSCVEPGMCQYTSTCTGGASCGASGCASSCTESPCRLLAPQCGCPTGQGCYPSGSTRACMAAGAGSAGAGCTTDSDCAPGNTCLNVSSGTAGVGVCTRLCTTDGECGATSSTTSLCVFQLDDGSGGTRTDISACSPVCNAVTQVGCPTGSECDLFQESTGAMRPFTACTAPVGTHAHGATCTGDEDCRAGFLCIPTTSTGPATCQHWCAYPSRTGCSSGESCYELTDPPTIVSGVDYGVCA